MHVDPFIVPQAEQFDRRPAPVNLITLQSAEFPSQLSETDSLEKYCALSGLDLTDADPEQKSEKHLMRALTFKSKNVL